MAANEFAEMLAAMDRWIATQEASGWPSPEVEKHASRVRNALWACAHDDDPHPATLAMLAEDTAALAVHRSSEHPH